MRPSQARVACQERRPKYLGKSQVRRVVRRDGPAKLPDPGQQQGVRVAHDGQVEEVGQPPFADPGGDLARQRISPKGLRHLHVEKVRRVQRLLRIQALATDPRPHGSEKLSGEDKYRIRQGSYRVVYIIEDAIVTVTVVRVARRSDVYR